MSEATDKTGGDVRDRRGGGRGAQQQGGEFDLAKATIPAVLDHVGVDVARATTIRDAELARGDDARPTLVEQLDAIITPPPAPERPRERAYPRERLVGPDGPRITGQPVHVIVGALEGVDGDAFTTDEINGLCGAFLARAERVGDPAQEEA